MLSNVFVYQPRLPNTSKTRDKKEMQWYINILFCIAWKKQSGDLIKLFLSSVKIALAVNAGFWEMERFAQRDFKRWWVPQESCGNRWRADRRCQNDIWAILTLWTFEAVLMLWLIYDVSYIPEVWDDGVFTLPSCNMDGTGIASWLWFRDCSEKVLETTALRRSDKIDWKVVKECGAQIDSKSKSIETQSSFWSPISIANGFATNYQLLV